MIVHSCPPKDVGANAQQEQKGAMQHPQTAPVFHDRGVVRVAKLAADEIDQVAAARRNRLAVEVRFQVVREGGGGVAVARRLLQAFQANKFEVAINGGIEKPWTQRLLAADHEQYVDSRAGLERR